MALYQQILTYGDLTVTHQKKAVKTAVGFFPRYAGEIKRAYEESGEFRSICSDLHACDRALIHWSNINTDDGAARKEEYGELLESLKQDVLNCLRSHGFLRKDDEQG